MKDIEWKKLLSNKVAVLMILGIILIIISIIFKIMSIGYVGMGAMCIGFFLMIKRDQ